MRCVIRLSSVRHSCCFPLMSDKTLRLRLFKAVLDAELPERTAGFVRAAWFGQDALEAELQGERYTAETAGAAQARAPSTYLQEVTVRGFRGIGPEATLRVPPGNGLTVVLGRNGSGKSSFAEGLEFLVTGGTARWATRKSKVWTAAWRNLHEEQTPQIDAIFAVEGKGPVRLTRRWSGDDLGSHELDKGSRDSMRELGWPDALGSYRPFLPYAELEAWAEKSTQIFDAVNAVLGLDAMDDAGDRLAAAQKRLDAQHKASVNAKKALVGALPSESVDPRVERLRAIVSGRKHDLEAAQSLLEDPVEDDGPVAQLRRLASLRPPRKQDVDAAISALRGATEAVAAAALARVGAAAVTSKSRTRSSAGGTGASTANFARSLRVFARPLVSLWSTPSPIISSTWPASQARVRP